MKAIKVTQEIKYKNSKFFENNNVGSIVKKPIPNRFNGYENVVGGYASREDLQALDGWKDIVIPTFDSAIEKRDNTLILSGDVYTYEVITLTEEEIDALIPSKISKLNFKIGLLTNHGITNAQVQEFFDGLEDVILREKLQLLWFESSFFERKDTNLVNFAPALGLTTEDLNAIFINFKGYN